MGFQHLTLAAQGTGKGIAQKTAERPWATTLYVLLDTNARVGEAGLQGN